MHLHIFAIFYPTLLSQPLQLLLGLQQDISMLTRVSSIVHSDHNKMKKKKRKSKGKKAMKDEAETDDFIVPGGPGTPTVVMKGWGALEALMKGSPSM